ncbi:UPF0481 protein At3g47200-like [Actinidia eriantha]|uniref:UPF0481 protein At3g47200-like n=1 Tax=Actinidia eriantha TaxID=165200 RepID=UPI00258C3565|nr:UPF0481 protein At3g47200-like [Actinidia eriantha]
MTQKPSSSSADPSSLPLSLQRMLKELPPPPSPSRTFIHRVPPELRVGNEHHYTPKMVSIGPFHAVGQELKSPAFHHILYLNPFHRGTILRNLYNFLREKEAEARGCYAETFKLNSDEFVQIMLRDCCFILALLTGFCPMRFGGERELFFHWILRDLLLLENQLPFFVLEGLSRLEGVFFSDLTKGNFRLYILEFFLPILPNRSFLMRDLVFPVTAPTHLLELVLLSVFPTRHPNAPLVPFRPRYFGKINLSELALYGITFSLNFVADSITDIKFSANGVLEVPPLRINESSTSLFKNLLAFEMCSSAQIQSCLVSYLFLMDSLLDTDKDVERLVSAGVLETTLNDKQALVTLFSELAANLVDDGIEYFNDVYMELQEYCYSRLARWRVKFVRYCSDLRLDILNCIILFIFVVAQTLFYIWTH